VPSASPSAPPAAAASPSPSPTPSQPGCIADYLTASTANYFTTSDPSADLTDLEAAIASAPPIFQQILDLRVGSHVDENSLRARQLYVIARALDEALPNAANSFTFGGATQGPIDISTLSSACFTGLDYTKCVPALEAAEATAAADRRQDVACDVARRAWLPTYTAVARVYKTWSKASPGKDLPYNIDYGAASGC
jgi:hypothetical protein